jgi:hypothetical protein
MDIRSSFPLPQSVSPSGHGGTIPALSELAVNRLQSAFTVEGSGTVNAITSLPRGAPVFLIFTGAPTFIHSMKLLMPGAVNKTFAPGDAAMVQSIGNGNWRCVAILPAITGPIFAFEGDSLSNTADLGTWPTQIASSNAFFARGKSYQFASNGDLAANMASEYVTQGGAIAIGSGTEAYYFLWVGTNDINVGSAASAIYGYLTAAWAAARSSGYKVVAFTIMRRGDFDATKNGVRDTLNALILSDPSLYDFLVRPDAIFSNPNDLTYFKADTVHLTAAGNAIIAQRAALALMPSSATPTYKNRILNGGMMVSQRNGSTVGTTNQYKPVDQFAITFSNAGSVSVAQVSSLTPGGSPNRLRVTVTAPDVSATTNKFSYIYTPIEGQRIADLAFGFVSAKQITIAFGIKAPAGVYSISLRNGAGTQTYIGEVTVSAGEVNADVRKFVTLDGAKSGTWDASNSVGLYLGFCLMCGPVFQQSAGSWASANTLGSPNQFNFMGTNGNVFELFDVDMYTGVDIRPFQLTNFASELDECERYYEKSYNYADLPGAVTPSGMAESYATAGAGFYQTRGPNWKRKRITPNVTLFSTITGASGKAYAVGAASDVTINTEGAGESGVSVYASLSAADLIRYQWVADAGL